MFSLIITIISIALVAALALATLYYGGKAFNQGSAEVRASELLNEGQQLMGAADLFFAERGVWPDSVEQMVSLGYLKTVPSASAGVSVAVAQSVTTWTIPTEGVPVFAVDIGNVPACQAVNQKTYGLDGVLPQINTRYIAQCWGEERADNSYRTQVVFGKSAEAFQNAASDLDTSLVTGALPDASDTAAWVVEPGVVVAGGSGGTDDTGDTGGTGDPGNTEPPPPATDPTQYLDVRITSFAFANDSTTMQPIPDSGNQISFFGPRASSGSGINWTCTVSGNLPDARLYQQGSDTYLRRSLGPDAYLPSGVGDMGDGTHISSYGTYMYGTGSYFENGGAAANLLSCTDGVVSLSTPDYNTLSFTPPAVASGGQVCLRFDSNWAYAGPGTCN